jgi:hypothetical protein
MVCFWCLQIRLGGLGHRCGLVTNRTCPLNRWSSGIIHAEFACGEIASGLAVLSRASDVKQAANSFHEKAGECQAFSFIFSFLLLVSFSKLFPLSQAASVATLPSALFVERLSLGASWVYSIQ